MLRKVRVIGRISRKIFNRNNVRVQLSSVNLRKFTSANLQLAKFSTPIPEFENEPGIKSHKDLYDFSLANPDEFWGSLARSRLEWFEEFDSVKDCNMETGDISWFLNGKINVSGMYI